MLAAVVNFTARQFGRAIVMPNLNPPVTTVAAAQAYRERIVAALSPDVSFTPLMTCYLTDGIDPAEVERGFKERAFTACKLYPAHATTNSQHGVTEIRNIYPVLETMQRIGMPLLVHGEVTEKHVDVFDREAVFIDRTLSRLVVDFPALKIVFEHITTAEAVAFVEQHRLALRRAATSGSPRYFLGTDSAPHAITDKESACGCAGVFNAPHALESYARTFEEEGALNRLEVFASENGPRFYGLPMNEERILLERAPQPVPARVPAAATQIVPFHAGETLSWRFAGRVNPA
jgi:dihydroorotase